MIIPIYQPLGESSHLLAQHAGKIHNTKATHTGTLDPMAQGVLIVLADQDRFNKSKYTEWGKTYEFEILVGVTTDTHDLLGLINNSSNTKQTNYSKTDIENRITKTLESFVGSQQQQIPTFSAKRIDGESYFDKAKGSESVPTETQQITIHSLKLEPIRSVGTDIVRTDIENKIGKVIGDFRQSQVQESWNNQQTVWNDQQVAELHIVRLTATTSKRTYIRGLVRDISQQTGIPMTTYSITRTKNGPYSIKDCVCLIQ